MEVVPIQRGAITNEVEVIIVMVRSQKKWQQKNRESHPHLVNMIVVENIVNT